MEPTFGIEIVQRDDAVVVVVIGEVDIATAPVLEQRLTEAEARDATSVIVDLDRVSFMDSTGLQVLVAHALSKDNGNRLFLTRGSAQVQRLFTISGMLDHLPFMPSEEP
jgi:anti-sigma B factor antagonist